MWELDHKKSECQTIDTFELWCWRRTLESPLVCNEIKLVNPKGNQPWIFIGRTDAEADTPTLWPADTKSRLIGKDPDAGKDWRQEEKEATEDEMVAWHHQRNGHEFKQTLKWSEVKSPSRVRPFVTPWTVAYQTPPSMGFSRQEYWSGLPFPSPGDLPNPGIKPGSPALQTDTLLSEPPGKPIGGGEE